MEVVFILAQAIGVPVGPTGTSLVATIFIIAKLSPAQSNSNSVGGAEIALISTFTHPQLELSLAQLSPSLF